MAIKNPDLDVRRFLRELFYDPTTGVFTDAKGHVVGRKDSDYPRLKIYHQGRNFQAHRLAWFYCYGRWPVGQIDHINRNALDNRIENLREATHSQNRINRVQPNHSTGFRGVDKKRNRYRARVYADGKAYNSKTFATPEEAHAEYLRMAVRLHGDFMIF
jgi:hypothetical protein